MVVLQSYELEQLASVINAFQSLVRWCVTVCSY